MDFHLRIKELRKRQKLSLQELENLSKVSKSMISKIERGEKTPTLQIAAQIAEGLGTTLSALLEERQSADFIILRRESQIAYTDEKSGFTRILLSPEFEKKGVEFVKNVIPIGSQSPKFPPHKKGVKEYVAVARGELRVVAGEREIELGAGDSVYYEAHCEHQFFNIGQIECHYYLVIDSHDA